MKIPGKLVTVNQHQMHVYYQAAGPLRPTIVLLAGSGTACPTYDFKALWQLLKKDYSIAVVERPGYGWSEITEKPRDVDTLLEETREALKQAGISGPFIPAAHSMSGLEAIYWAQKYREEVSAIIGLDMAVPAAYEEMALPKAFGLTVRIGQILRRPITTAMVRSHSAVKKRLLTKEEQDDMKQITAQQLLSKNMVSEINYVKANAKKVAAGACPQISVLCILADDKNNLKKIPSWGKIHKEYFAANQQTEFLELNCGHYVHNEEPERVAKAIEEFVN
ncbi:alpha/beta fold hydrolase [Enterococcus sp. AZ072]|uniref:alpha/beta fold hydrolase n=1 Tax=unclassified Enterococcus TaxID=2608891 RepID=UPI003D2B4F78